MISTRDVDEARAAFGRVYAAANLEPIGGASFGLTLDVVTCGAVSVVAGSWAGGARACIPLNDTKYVLSLSDVGHSEVSLGGEHVATVHGRRGALYSAGRGAVILCRSNFEGRSIVIERGALEAHFRALTGHERRGPIQFDPALDLSAGPGAAVFEIAQTFRREVHRPGASQLLIAVLRDALVTGLLTNTRHSASALFAPTPPRVAPAYVRRAEEYIDAHASEPITLTGIAAMAGVSVRSLQAAFKALRGTTPMERLRGRRLELARQRLADAAPGTTVAGVVIDLGLGDAGRFSANYRQRFGESPSETLARARRPMF